MSKGINKDGTPKKRPVNSGRAPKIGGKKKGPFVFSADVVAILEAQDSITGYIEDAVRKKHKKETK